MERRICAADDCSEPFDPVLPEQLYHSDRCAARMRMRRYRARRKPKPNGGPGGGKQPMLFSRSAMRSRKPARSVMKPKQDALFPADISNWFAGLSAEQQREIERIVAEAKVRAASDNGFSAAAESAAADIMLTSRRRPAVGVSVSQLFAFFEKEGRVAA